jgi:hypothetical protein
MVATLQSQLEQVLGGLAQLTSTIQRHDSCFDNLNKFTGTATLPEAIQCVKILVTGRLDEISGLFAQIGRNVSGLID